MAYVEQLAWLQFVKLPRHSGVELADLVAAGVFGLAKSVERFDPNRHTKFRTYATQRVLGAMKDWLRDIDWVPRLVRARGETPVGMQSAEDVLAEGTRAVRLIDVIPDPAAGGAVEDLEREEVLDRLMSSFNRAERAIVKLYWFQDLTMKQIGGELGLSESRVSQMTTSILARLRAEFRYEQLAPLLLNR